jgi:methyl-accepting chemotaxis protein
VTQARHAAATVATSSSQIAAGSADLSQRTDEQASSLEETAASLEELTATVQQNAQTAQRVRQVSLHAADAATRSNEVMLQVVGTMGNISESSRRVAEIIDLIDNVAFRTNILALNAAVESARAGEHGRGFAVVAGEVRSLAQRSAEAAKEIRTLIGDSARTVQAGGLLATQAGQAIDGLREQVRQVSDLVALITAASVEQGTGINQVSDAVTQLDRATQQNAALVEESAAAAASLQQQAEDMARIVAVFRLD